MIYFFLDIEVRRYIRNRNEGEGEGEGEGEREGEGEGLVFNANASSECRPFPPALPQHTQHNLNDTR